MIQENQFSQPQLSDAGASWVALLSFSFCSFSKSSMCLAIPSCAQQILHVPSNSFKCLAILHVPSSSSCAKKILHVPSNPVFFMCRVTQWMPSDSSCAKLPSGCRVILHVPSYLVDVECFFMCQVTQYMLSASILDAILRADLRDLFHSRHLC